MTTLLSSKRVKLKTMENEDLEWFISEVKTCHFNEGQLYKYRPNQDDKILSALYESMPYRKVMWVDGKRIGGIALIPYLEGVELSYFLSEKYEGKGYMSEILVELIKRIRYSILYCNILNTNERSIKLVERLGFKCVGVEGNIVRMVRYSAQNG